MIGNDELVKQELLSHYSILGPDDKEKKTWEVISKFPKPTVIGLDRNLYAEESSEKYYIEESLKGRLTRKKNINPVSPLDRVKEIINCQYQKQKNEILEHTNSLKNHLMLSTFDGSITKESFTSGIKYKLNPNQISNAEKRVNDYFEQFEESNFFQKEQETINKYFSDLKAVTKEYHNSPEVDINKLLYGLNANQFVKVRKLLKEFEKFDDKVSKIKYHVTTFLSTTSNFLICNIYKSFGQFFDVQT